MEQKCLYDVTIRTGSADYPEKTLIVLADSEDDLATIVGTRRKVTEIRQYPGRVLSTGPSRVIGWTGKPKAFGGPVRSHLMSDPRFV